MCREACRAARRSSFGSWSESPGRRCAIVRKDGRINWNWRQKESKRCAPPFSLFSGYAAVSGNNGGPSGCRELRKRGVSVREAWNTSKSAHGPWRPETPALTIALPLHFFKNLGLPNLVLR